MCQWLCVVIVHPFTQLYALGTSKEVCTFQVKFLVVSVTRDLCEFPPPRQNLYIPLLTTLSTPRHARGRVSDLWVLMVVGVMSTLAAGHLPPQCLLGSILPHSGFAGGGGFSGRGHLRSASLSPGMVPASSLSINQLAISCGTSSVCHIGGGNQ